MLRYCWMHWCWLWCCHGAPANGRPPEPRIHHYAPQHPIHPHPSSLLHPFLLPFSRTPTPPHLHHPYFSIVICPIAISKLSVLICVPPSHAEPRQDGRYKYGRGYGRIVPPLFPIHPSEPPWLTPPFPPGTTPATTPTLCVSSLCTNGGIDTWMDDCVHGLLYLYWMLGTCGYDQ